MNRLCCTALLAVTLTACTSEHETQRQNTAAAPATVVSLTAAEYALQAPDSIAAGWTTFRMANAGGEVHYGHIVRLDSGRTIPEMVFAYAEAIRTSGPRPKWVARFGGPGAAAPGDTSDVTQFLEPGSYVWICPVEDSAGVPHFSKGEFKAFVVRAADSVAANEAAAPKADAEVRLTDYSFVLGGPLQAGAHTVRVVNTGMQPHDLVLMKLAPGITVEDVRDAMNPERPRRPEQRQNPPRSPETLGTGAGGVASMGPGKEAFFQTVLTAGEYVLMCMTTAPDGRSHIEHGMIQQITVP